MRSLLLLLPWMVACAPEPELKIALIELPVTTVSIFVNGSCPQEPCSWSLLDRAPLVAPGQSFRSPLALNFQRNPIISSCGSHVAALVRFSVWRPNTDGGHERIEGWAASFDVAHRYEVTGQGNDGGVLYELRSDGTQPFGPSQRDAGLYWSAEYSYRPVPAHGEGFEFTEMHIIQTSVDVIEERYGECSPMQEPYIRSPN